MAFLNLGAGELLTLLGIVSGIVVALYLLDRTRHRYVVATLRFWTAGLTPERRTRRRKVHQPLSLLLQLLSLALLLLAIAGPRFGGSGGVRDHVLLLDISAWMGARARQGILLDQTKTAALAYLDSLPVSDRVMIVRTDALPTPVTPFELDRKVLRSAIENSQPSTSALNLTQAFEYAQHSLSLQSERAGEIVFAGAGRISAREAADLQPPRNLRFLQVPSAGENIGLRKLGARPSGKSMDEWEAFVSVGNDGVQPREVALELHLAGSPIGGKPLTLAPSSEVQVTFPFRNHTGGTLEARIRSTNGRGDAFPADDRALVDLAGAKATRVIVYTNDPELLRPLLGATPQVSATFLPPAKFNSQAESDVLIFDRFVPSTLPVNTPSIWIEPPAGSPFAVIGTKSNVKVDRWLQSSPLAGGLYSTDIRLPAAQSFRLAAGDQAVAEADGAPIMVARNGAVKMVALGFHPMRSPLKFELSTPLLIANALRWIVPDSFRRRDVQTSTVGSVDVALDAGTDAAAVRVVDRENRAMPFTLANHRLRFFSGAPSVVRVITGQRETAYSLTLPDVSGEAWKPPSQVPTGLPRTSTVSAAAANWWPWLAVLGALGLLAEWLLFGESRIRHLRSSGDPKNEERLSWKKAS